MYFCAQKKRNNNIISFFMYCIVWYDVRPELFSRIDNIGRSINQRSGTTPGWTIRPVRLLLDHLFGQACNQPSHFCFSLSAFVLRRNQISSSLLNVPAPPMRQYDDKPYRGACIITEEDEKKL